MPTNTYTDEFRRRAVELYESTPDTTFQAIANDLGISRGALKTWVTKYGSGQIRATGGLPGSRHHRRGPNRKPRGSCV